MECRACGKSMLNVIEQVARQHGLDYRCECGHFEQFGRLRRNRHTRPLNSPAEISKWERAGNPIRPVEKFNRVNAICAACPAGQMIEAGKVRLCRQSGAVLCGPIGMPIHRVPTLMATSGCPLGFWGPRRILWLARPGERRAGERDDRPESRVTRWDVTEATDLAELQEAIADTSPAVVFASRGTISPEIWARLRAQNRYTRFVVRGEARRRVRIVDCDEAAPSPAVVSRLAVVTCFFNPHRSRRRVANYPRFAAGIREQGLPLFCVEGLFGDEPSQIDSTWRVRIDPEAQFWHKESLLNWAVRRLPEAYDAILCVDADVIYDRQGLGDRVLELLAEYEVVQAWSQMTYLGPDYLPAAGERRPSTVAVRRVHPTASHGCPGGAWAARRETWERVGGMYDTAITGGGDVVWCGAAMNDATQIEIDNWPTPFRDHMLAWGRGLALLTGGRVGLADESTRHLYHGSRLDRQYASRHTALRASGFNPELDLQRDGRGMLRWSPSAPAALRLAVRQYMHSRREDD